MAKSDKERAAKAKKEREFVEKERIKTPPGVTRHKSEPLHMDARAKKFVESLKGRGFTVVDTMEHKEWATCKMEVMKGPIKHVAEVSQEHSDTLVYYNMYRQAYGEWIDVVDDEPGYAIDMEFYEPRKLDEHLATMFDEGMKDEEDDEETCH